MKSDFNKFKEVSGKIKKKQKTKWLKFRSAETVILGKTTGNFSPSKTTTKLVELNHRALTVSAPEFWGQAKKN